MEYFFGPFRFIPAQQILLHGEIPLRLGNRALEILRVLLERSGEVVGKQELLNQVWPTTVVEESNLKVHIAGLRRALGERKNDNNYIVTVSGRGYRFAAPVSSSVGATPRHAAGDATQRRHNLPASLSRMVGRCSTVASVRQTLDGCRMVSIVGPAGIGKTTVALSIAEEIFHADGIDVCHIDLGALADGRFAASAIAAALGLTIHSGDGTQVVLSNLRERTLLLMFDSCEHLIADVAVLAGQVLAAAPGVRILATSREPLRTAGEHVHRMAPLVYPAERRDISAADAMGFPAVQLFVERAAQTVGDYQLTDSDASAVADICRRLEGNALAIELAATRIDAFGARELAARLDDRFQLLKRGRRTALERHSSLAAALDWSYDFLPESEQALLRSLSVFAGPFSLEWALALAGGDTGQQVETIECIGNLVAKSLLSADVGGDVVLYRLLDTTKAYGLDKLEQYGELDALRRRHAETLCQLLGTEPQTRGVDDVRTGLGWAYSASGDAAIGIKLTIAAVPLWMQHSLLEECRQSVQRALACDTDAQQEMMLNAALAAAILYTHGPLEDTRDAWSRTLALADELADREYQLRALWGLAVFQCYAGNHRAVRALAERYCTLADSLHERPAVASMDRLVGTALYYGGEQAAARQELERMLRNYVPPTAALDAARFQLDQRGSALGALSNVLWLQGLPDQAVKTAQEAMRQARASQQLTTFLNTLTQSALPVLLHVGDHDGAAALLDELANRLQRHALPTWDTLLRCLTALLQVERGDLSAIPALYHALDALRAARLPLRFTSYQGVLAAALGADGRHEEGLHVIGQAIACCAAGYEHWCLPELLRIQGTLLESSDAAAAMELYRRSIELARQQGALSWELRTASSLAALLMQQDSLAEAQSTLAASYGKFSEGFSSRDLRRAQILAEGWVPG